MAQNDSGQPTLMSSTTAREQARAAGCLQRISLPGRRDQRRPKGARIKRVYREAWRASNLLWRTSCLPVLISHRTPLTKVIEVD